MAPLLSQAAPGPALQPLMAQTLLWGGGWRGRGGDREGSAWSASQPAWSASQPDQQDPVAETASLWETQLLTSWDACFVPPEGAETELSLQRASEGAPLTGVQRLLEVSNPGSPGAPRPESLLSWLPPHRGLLPRRSCAVTGTA